MHARTLSKQLGYKGFAALCFSFLCMQASAQAPNPATPLSDVPPPPTITTPEEAAAPAVTIRKENGATHEEYRIHGKLYMVKVTPAQGPTYYLIDREGQGNFVRQSEVLPNMAVPQWVLLTW